MEPAEQNVVKGTVRRITTGISGSIELSFVSPCGEKLERLDGILLRMERLYNEKNDEVFHYHLSTCLYLLDSNLFGSWINFRQKNPCHISAFEQ